MSEAKKQDISVSSGREVAPTVDDSVSLIQVIERAATNPQVDIDKMERLMAMHERLLAKNAESAFNQAMSAVQSKLRQVAADANNPQTRSKYASYSALDKAIRPIYTDAGFSLSFDTSEGAPPDHVRVVCYVSHVGGHSRQHHVDMPADGKGAKGGDVMTKTHAFGAGVAYGMRYLLRMIFNMAVGDDNDGNDPKEYITESQAADLKALLEETKSDTVAFCAHFKISKIEELSKQAFNHAVKMVEAKRKRAAK